MPSPRDEESWSDPMIETVNEAVGILTLGATRSSPVPPVAIPWDASSLAALQQR